MKSKISIFIVSIIFVLTLIIVFSRISIPNRGIKNEVQFKDYNIAYEDGLKKEGINNDSILYEENIEENKIIVFTKNNGLGIAYMIKDRDGWKWERRDALYDFVSESKSPSYMASCKEINIGNSKKYFLVCGRIFNNNISKLTLANDAENAIIKSINVKASSSMLLLTTLEGDLTPTKGILRYEQLPPIEDGKLDAFQNAVKTFWFKVISDDNLFRNIKVYDSNGKCLE